MKSIMEEASSIIKAIEKGWVKAGEQKEFSVKVFEHPQKNFIGITVRSAKIGIFFNEGAEKHEPDIKQKKVEPKSVTPKPFKEKRQPKPERSKPEQVRTQKKEITPQDHAGEQQEVRTPVWSTAMISDVQNWLQGALAFMSVRPMPFTQEAHHFYLKVQFKDPVYEDSNREKMLFASLATLLLQLLKNKHKRPLKGYKIILTSKHES